MEACKNLRALNRWQFYQLQEHISKHKYYEGEHHHYFNTSQDLERDFIEHFFLKVAKEMRAEFCKNHCPYFEECVLAKKMIDNDS